MYCIYTTVVRPEEEEEYEFAIDEHFTKEAFAMAISGKYIPKRQRRSSRSASAEPRDTPTMNEENPTIYEEQRTSKSWLFNGFTIFCNLAN